MSHVVTRPHPPFSSADGSIEVHQLPAWQDNLVWLVVDPVSRACAAVDGPEAGTVLTYCEKNDLALTTILNTHTHGDHIGINRDLAQRGQLAGLRVVGPELVRDQVPGITEAVDHGDRVRFGGATAQVFLTEGHINGHICYLFDDVLFCGDTLFTGGCGYLFDGPPQKMFESLRLLSSLPEAVRVCCAHEYTEDNLRFAWSVEDDNRQLAERIRDVWRLRAEGRPAVPSTIGTERATNPFLRWHSPSLRASVQRAMPGHPLNTDAEVFAATRALKDRRDYRGRGDAGLPL